MGWRLFERLEKGVGRLVVEVIGIVQDGHLAPAACRLQREVAAQLAHQLDGKLVLFFRTDDRDEVWMGVGIYQPAGNTAVAGLKRGGRRLTQQGLAQFGSEELLPDSGRSHKQVRVRQPAAL